MHHIENTDARNNETTALLQEQCAPPQTSQPIDRYTAFVRSIFILALITALLPALTLLATVISLSTILSAGNTLVLLYTILAMVCTALAISLLSAIIGIIFVR